MKKNPYLRFLFGLLSTFGIIISTGLLNSCAYTETMNDRNTEGWKLQNELNYEVERGKKLSR